MASKKGLGRGLGSLLPEVGTDDKDVRQVPIGQIVPNPFQPRKQFDEAKLAELTASVKAHGVLQPVLLRQFGNMYELVAGERRWRAAQRAGLESIPAAVREFSDGAMMEIALVENLQREDLNPMEEAEAYRRLMDEFGLTQEQLSTRLSRSRSLIANTLRLLNLPQEIQEHVSRGTLTMGHAKALLGLDSPKEQYKAVEEILSRGLTVRDVEADVRKAVTGKQRRRVRSEPDEVLTAAVDRLRMLFGTQVRIRGTPARGKVEVEYYTSEDLARILELCFSLDQPEPPRQREAAAARDFKV